MSNRDRPLRSGYNTVGNQIWTLDIGSPKAVLLLGWLHSHADNYQERLSLTRIGNEFGGGRKSVTRMCRLLADAGFVTIESTDNGYKSHLILVSEAWEDLTHRDAGTRVTMTQGVGHHDAGDLCHHDAPEEEQLLEQPVENKQIRTCAPSFDAWYSRWPKKQGKDKARQRWAKMSSADRSAAFKATPAWIDYALDSSTGNQYVPMASTWLNQSRWEDDPPQVSEPDNAHTRSMAVLRRATVENTTDIFAISERTV